jgi:hypothetical protein
MAKNIQVHIPEPCHQDWGKMQPEEKGRFCSSCAKTVVDFSLMSDRDVLSWLADAGGKTCGRFTAEQLNRNLMSVPERKRRGWSAWNVVLIGLLLSSKAEAQTKTMQGAVHLAPKKKRDIVVPDHAPDLVTGDIAIFVQEPDRGSILVKVIDSVSSVPVANATIHIGGGIQIFSADTAGEFWMTPKMVAEVPVMEISAVGYATRKVALDVPIARQKNLTINLAPQIASLPPIEVRGFPPMGKMRVVVGGARATCIKHTDTSSMLTPIRKLVSDTLAFLGMPRRAMSFYPNPAMRGSVIQVSIRPGQAGPYRLALYNAAGSLVLERSVEMNEKEQMELLNIPASLAGGIYFVQLSGAAMRRPYTAKLLVQ